MFQNLLEMIKATISKHSYPFKEYYPKMVRHTLKILQEKQQNFKSVSDYFETLCMKWLSQKIKHFQEKEKIQIAQNIDEGIS